MKICKVIFLIVSLSFSIASADPAKSDPPLRFKTYKDVERSAKIIRAHEKEIRTYYMQVVLRKAQLDIALVLKRQHMSDEEIQKIMESDAMKNFLSKLEHQPRIQEKVDFHVQKLLAPGAIEAHVLKRREQLAKEIQGQTQIALSEIQKSPTFLTREDILEPEDQRSMAEKLWEHLIHNLYQN